MKSGLFGILLSIPKTIWFNFHFLPFSLALKMPIWIHYGTRVSVKRGRIDLSPSAVKTAMIRIGFHTVAVKDSSEHSLLQVEDGGFLIFRGTAHIGRGSRIFVSNHGKLVIGDNFSISASSSIFCHTSITIGRDVLLAWDCMLMDSDSHIIYDNKGQIINPDAPIELGDKIWLGSGSTIMKGVHLNGNNVVAAGSIVTAGRYVSNYIIAGCPAKRVKEIGGWQL